MASKEYNDEKLRAKGVIPFFYQEFVAPMIKKLKGNKCEVCGSLKFLDLHHKTYDECTINDFQLLCRKCHKSIHKKLTYKNLKWKVKSLVVGSVTDLLRMRVGFVKVKFQVSLWKLHRLCLMTLQRRLLIMSKIKVYNIAL